MATRTPHREDLAGEIREITDLVGLDDLTDPELEALRALLRPAFARVGGYRPATWGDRDALISRVKYAMEAVARPENFTTEELHVFAAVLEIAAQRVNRPAENVITFAAARRARGVAQR